MENILIIGTSGGIGKQLAKDLSKKQIKVYGTYFNTKMNSDSEFLSYHYLNVLDDKPSMDFLPKVIDGIVYCPGAIKLKPFVRIKPTEFISDYNLQVLGAIKVIQAVIPRLKLSDNGSIVLFSTIASQFGFRYHSLISSSKGAIEGLTKALAAEFAPNIRVNCIAPSLTKTGLSESILNTEEKEKANAERHPLKRIGSVNDISSSAAFLLSKESSWITGQVLHVDGGISTLNV